MRVLIVLLIINGVIVLQVFLSKKENKWPGLVLPMISFLISFLYPLNMAIPSVGGVLVSLTLGWLAANIPTAVLLAVYFGCRGKQRRKQQLNKMNIQDLG